MNIKENVHSILSEVKKIALESQREVSEIKVIAVTKTHPSSMINEVINSGIEIFAENKVQEAEQKIPDITAPFKEFHFIGHLQSNKINKVLKLNPDLIHSIDKVNTAEKLNEACAKLNRIQRILIEVNTSGEISKNGVSPDDLMKAIEDISQMDHLRIEGLMTIGALSEDEGITRNCFRELKQLSEQVKQKNFKNTNMIHLSMGMSHDFRIAIEEGATFIRIGTLFFGERVYFKS